MTAQSDTDSARCVYRTYIAHSRRKLTMNIIGWLSDNLTSNTMWEVGQRPNAAQKAIIHGRLCRSVRRVQWCNNNKTGPAARLLLLLLLQTLVLYCVDDDHSSIFQWHQSPDGLTGDGSLSIDIICRSVHPVFCLFIFWFLSFNDSFIHSLLFVRNNVQVNRL